MPVDQNRATSGQMFVACPDDGMSARRNKLCLQSNAGESFHEPVRAFGHPLGILVVSRNTWKAQERIKIFEVIFTHGDKLIGFRSLPTLSAESDRGRDKRLTQQPVRLQ